MPETLLTNTDLMFDIKVDIMTRWEPESASIGDFSPVNHSPSLALMDELGEHPVQPRIVQIGPLNLDTLEKVLRKARDAGFPFSGTCLNELEELRISLMEQHGGNEDLYLEFLKDRKTQRESAPNLSDPELTMADAAMGAAAIEREMYDDGDDTFPADHEG